MLIFVFSDSRNEILNRLWDEVYEAASIFNVHSPENQSMEVLKVGPGEQVSGLQIFFRGVQLVLEEKRGVFEVSISARINFTVRKTVCHTFIPRINELKSLFWQTEDNELISTDIFVQRLFLLITKAAL